MKSDNELIAAFMGRTRMYESTHEIFVLNLKYDHDWSWLMPVVEKIETYGTIVELNICLGTVCRITAVNPSGGKVKDFVNGGSISLLDATYLSVVEFIKWHNEIQKPLSD